MKDLSLGQAILKQAGIELKLRGAITWIDDPNNNEIGHQPGWVSIRATSSGLTTEIETLFQQSRSTNLHDINVYYVLAALDQDKVPPGLANLFGETFTNDVITGMNNETESGIIVTRFGEGGDPPQALPRLHHGILAHEILHFLLDSPHNIEWEHNPPDASYLMWPYDEPGGFKIGSDHISNAQNNSDESAFIERF